MVVDKIYRECFVLILWSLNGIDFCVHSFKRLKDVRVVYFVLSLIWAPQRNPSNV